MGDGIMVAALREELRGYQSRLASAERDMDRDAVDAMRLRITGVEQELAHLGVRSEEKRPAPAARAAEKRVKAESRG